MCTILGARSSATFVHKFNKGVFDLRAKLPQALEVLHEQVFQWLGPGKGEESPLCPRSVGPPQIQGLGMGGENDLSFLPFLSPWETHAYGAWQSGEREGRYLPLLSRSLETCAHGVWREGGETSCPFSPDPLWPTSAGLRGLKRGRRDKGWVGVVCGPRWFQILT